MATFDRFDICEAYAAIEADYNAGGVLQERPSNKRRSMSTDFQLGRMKFKPVFFILSPRLNVLRRWPQVQARPEAPHRAPHAQDVPPLARRCAAPRGLPWLGVLR